MHLVWNLNCTSATFAELQPLWPQVTTGWCSMQQKKKASVAQVEKSHKVGELIR